MERKRAKQTYLGFSLLFVLLAVFLIWNLLAGSVSLSASSIWEILHGAGEATQRRILLQIRLPRLLAAMILGGALSVCPGGGGGAPSVRLVSAERRGPSALVVSIDRRPRLGVAERSMLMNAESRSRFSPTALMRYIEKYVTAPITNTRIAPNATPMCTSANGMLSTPEPTIVFSR